MAHFKRKRSRTSPSGGYSNNAMKHRLGSRYDEHAWIRNYPRHHDKVFHTRPRRRAEQRLERAVVKGADPDEINWPVSRKPHIYYW